jgi:hypothetical protein
MGHVSQINNEMASAEGYFLQVLSMIVNLIIEIGTLN